MRRGFFYAPTTRIYHFLSLTLWAKPFEMAACKKMGFYISLCVMLSSCEFKCSVGNDSQKDKAKTSATQVITKEGTILTNNISLRTHNIKVKKATLMFPDNSPVPDDNNIDLNEKIWLYLFIEDGWKIKDERVLLGASESMYTDDGQTVLDEKDLFSNHDSTGLTPENSKIIKISSLIKTESPGIKYYKVMFRVWDKNGDAEIAGHYTFSINH